MKRNMVAVAILLAVSVVFAEGTPQVVNKYFAGWIPQLEFDSTNDCYVAQYNPAARRHAYVHTSKREEYLKIQPGECYAVARGERALFTQHAGGVGWALTFTNGIGELNGVSLPAEFKNSSRQLLIEGNRALRYRVFENYAFIVNADGEAYDVGTRTKFHFGFPFHAPEDKAPPKLDRSMENIQRLFCGEGANAYKKSLGALNAQGVGESVKEGSTNAVPFVWEMGGVGNLSEKDRSYLVHRDPEATRLFAMLEKGRTLSPCTVFFVKEKGATRIVATARIDNGAECRLWTYEGSEIPALIFLRNVNDESVSSFEYGGDGLLRNFCVVQKKKIADYQTITDGVLQKSADMQKAQELVSKVEEMFNRYVELDTTGTLKSFVDKVKSCDEHAKGK